MTDQMTRIRGLLLASAALLPLFAAGAAAAQSDGANDVEEVVVTATKTATRILEVPQTISVVGRQEMDLRGVQDLNQALSYSSGIRFRDYPGQQGMQEFFMRGFRVNNTGQGLYRDGTRVAFNGLDADVETYGLERVELLKGPASVLYGAGAPGGLVNAITKRPQRTFGGEILGQLGSFERKQLAGDVGGPIDADGKYAYRLTGLYRDSETQFDYTVDNRQYLAPAFTWRPTEQTSLTILAQYFQTEIGGSDQSFPVSGTLQSNPNGQIRDSLFLGDPAANEFKVSNRTVSYELKHDFGGGLKFAQNLRYTNAELDYAGVTVAGNAVLTANRLLNRGAQVRNTRTLAWTTDANLSWNKQYGDIENTLLGGVDYTFFRRTWVQRAGTIGQLDVFNPVYGQPITWAGTLQVNTLTKLLQTGVYIQDQFKWRGLTILAGLRQDWVTTLTFNNNTNAGVPLDKKALTGRVGAIYEFDNGFAPYVSYSTSFTPQPGSYAPARGGAPFDPTTGIQYEAGIKYTPNPGILINAAVYQLTQEMNTTPDPLNPGFFIQQGEAQAKGFELEAEWKLWNTNFNASYTYTDSIVTEANDATVGQRQLGIPEHAFSAWANHEFDVGPGKLNLGAGVRYFGDSYNLPTTAVGGPLKVDGYTLVDALAQYTIDRTSLSLNVTNLFDETYFAPAFYAQSVFFGYRRNVMATLRYKW